MTLASTQSYTLVGLNAVPVHIEADLSGGLPQFNLLGLPAQAARESRDRVRVAIQNLGFGFPAGRVTVQLTAQESLECPALADLAIAAALLAAMGRIPVDALAQHALLGQLSLSGALLPLDHERAWVQGALALEHPLILPPLRLEQPQGLGCPRLGSVESLSALVDFARGRRPLTPPPAHDPCRHASHRVQARPAPRWSAVEGHRPEAWDEISGQALAKRAAIVALAGGHHLLMLGPPGVGKSMIAHRMSALQPALEPEQAHALAAVQALEGLDCRATDARIAPFRAPHHSASAASLFGGGRPFRPGEISLAHGGLLFLDELAEFRRDALEALREPLETGSVQPARLQSRFIMPARAQLIAAMNPCPCGRLGSRRSHRPVCRCSVRQVQAYRAKLSAPLLDRFDLVILMQALPSEPQGPDGEAASLTAQAPLFGGADWTGQQARLAIETVRALARGRQPGLNAQLSEAELMRMPIDASARLLLKPLHTQGHWSRRALVGILRVARTLADLAGQEAIDSAALAQAVELRRGLQLMEAAEQA